MAVINLTTEDMRPLVREVVQAVLAASEMRLQLLNGKLAVSEAEAAAYLDLNPWQLRDLRLARKITHSRIVGGRIRYTLRDLEAYLERNRGEAS